MNKPIPSTSIVKPLLPRRSSKRRAPGAKGCFLLTAASLLGSLVLASPAADAAVTFTFVYSDAAGTGFNDPAHPEYKAGLEDAAKTMGNFYAHTANVTLMVSSTNNPSSSTLASAGSPVVDPNGGSKGFFRTVVQAKVISNGALDLNGADPDGEVNVNLGSSFEYNPNVAIAADKIDFKSTMIHEFTHAFGFTSSFSKTPNTTSPDLYSIFDSFLTTNTGQPLIDPNTFIFDASKVSTLTGGNSGLQDSPNPAGEFFYGPKARAAFGAPVPIFSPNPYQEGSSGSHVDDNTAATKPFLMAAATENGPKMMGMTGERAYSKTEEAMLADLGFSLASAAPAHAPFFAGESALANGVYYLAFPNGNFFGYYSFLSDPRYIFHQDLGYEYVFDANDGKSGVYFYDFKSGGYFYTSPSFPFPYLYDFSLNSTVYYYPDPNNAGRYNTDGTRYFYVFSTGQIISK